MLKLKISLIFSILSLTAIRARSLEGYQCKDYPIPSGDPFTPPRIVRICGVVNHESRSSYFPALADQENILRPNNRLTQSLYSEEDIWCKPQYQHTPPAFPLNVWSTYNNEQETISPTPQLPVFPNNFDAFKRNVASLNNPSNYYNNNHNLNSHDNQMEVKLPLQEEQIKSLLGDVSEVKDSVKDLVSYLQTILDVLIVQKSNQQREKRINVNLKLDPSFESILKQFLQLTDQNVSSTEKRNEETSTESIEEVEGSPEYFGSFPSSELTTENNSNENTTEQNEENSNEEYSKEDDRNREDFDGWLSEHFGPAVNKRDSDEEIEDIFNETSEEENSGDKSDESFETWFNTVYRRITTEAPNDNNESNENTEDSKESIESNETNDGSSKSYVENSNGNQSKENTSSQVLYYMGKSTEAEKPGEENIDKIDERNYYDTLSLPTTISAQKQNSKAQDLEKMIHAGSKQMKFNKCFRLTLSVKNFDDKELWNLVRKCVEEKATENFSVEESKESGGKDSDESKGSAEKDSDESKDSNETEPPTKDSDESKESGETESTVTESNESKGSYEDTDSSKSKENNWHFVYPNDDY